ncbi:MAG TPA: hypothetical protein VIK78_14470 [Ruminiclostridium sp.]
MIAVALFLIAAGLIIFILHPLIEKWIDVGIKQFENRKSYSSK